VWICTGVVPRRRRAFVHRSRGEGNHFARSGGGCDQHGGQYRPAAHHPQGPSPAPDAGSLVNSGWFEVVWWARRVAWSGNPVCHRGPAGDGPAGTLGEGNESRNTRSLDGPNRSAEIAM